MGEKRQHSSILVLTFLNLLLLALGSVCMEENDWDEAIIKLDEAAGVSL